MKKLFTILFVLCISSFAYSQITIDVQPTDSSDECNDVLDPDSNAAFQAWLTNYGGTSASSVCGTINDPWFTGYAGNADWDTSDPCDISVTIFWEVTDDCASAPVNTVPVTFNLVDTEAPMWDALPQDIEVPCDGAGNLSDIQDWIDDIEMFITTAASDGCQEATNLTVTNDWNGVGVDCATNDLDVNFTLEDMCGNTASQVDATFTVTDDTPPTFDVEPVDLVVDCDGNGNTTDISNWLGNFGDAMVSDNCSPASGLLFTDDYDGSPPTDCGQSGVETVTFTAEDECGNQTTFEADIVIDDFDPPTITAITNNLFFECHQENVDIQAEIDAIVLAAQANDLNDCTAASNLIWTVNPDPAPTFPTTQDPNCPGETLAGDFEFTVTVQDECGNISAAEDVVITMVDSTPPALPPNAPGDVEYDCGDEIPPPPTLYAIDDCWSIEALFSETIVTDNCDNQIEIHRTWIFEDGCLNDGGTHTQIIIVDDQDGPEWLGNTDDYLPGDIEILIADCTNGFTFPNGYFENPSTGEAWPDFPLQEGTHYEDNCSGTTFTAVIPPNEQFGEGETTVTYTVTDACGNSITHEFVVNLICANCVGGGLFCPECETSVEDGCFTCNIQELLDGFNSCTPEFEGGIQNSQPSPLCNGAGVPHNMSWFAFVAGGTELCVTVAPFQCAMGSGSIGLQSGVYDFCEDEGGECIGGDAFCSSGLDPITYNVTEMVVGNTYYLFVDGCNGAECDYEITIEKGYEFALDTPDEVVVVASCEQVPGFPPLVYCPETVLQFDIHHLGDSPSDMGDYDDEGPYDPDLAATFYWTFDPEIEGMSDGEWNQIDEGYNIPPLSFDDVTEPTEFTVCLTEIEAECDTKSCDECCLTFIIQPLPDEFFGPYKVCVEDLLNPNGWDPGIVGEDPNGDGIEWLGPTNITLDQVEMAEMGILEFQVFDPSCNCEFIQSVQIEIIGNINPVPVTLYMFDCQFRDEDGDAEEYEWIWPTQIFDLEGDEFEEIFNLEMVSEERDWDMERCDSLIMVTVDTIPVLGELFAGPCTPNGTSYWFELLLEDLEDFHPDHPEIFPNYIVEWVDAMTDVTVQVGDTFNVLDSQEGLYIVRVEYFFFDGAYGEDAAVTTSCIKDFGPFDLESGTATPPDFLRMDTLFCEDDLTDKLFVINPFEGSTYQWTFPPGAVGVVNTPLGDTATVDFTNYDFNANIPLSVLANTVCGQSPSLEIFVSINPLPVPQIVAPIEVCVNEFAEANFSGDPGEIASYSWSNFNYINGNQSGPGPVNYASSTSGSFDIELIVIDNNGCESLPVLHTIDVIEELPAPILDCSTTANSITFSWQAIPGATGYTINVLQSPNGTSTIVNSDTETSVLFDALNVLDEVEVSVYANGLPPCGDGPAASILCQAQDCPDPLWQFNLFPLDTSYCVNAPITPFNYDVTGTDDGVATYVGNGVSPTGLFDPSSPDIVIGTNMITMTYTYQNSLCTQQRTVTVEVFPVPSADFTVSDNEICLGESVVIDDSQVDEVANWNGYDGGIVNAMGEISWDTPGLKTIVLDVISPDNLGNCVSQNTATVMVLDTVIMGPVSCIDQDLDFVHFDWDDAFSATGYDITYTVNGGTAVNTSITDSEIIINTLMPGDVVDIVVTALSANSCPNVASSFSCIAVDCIPLNFNGPLCSSVGIDFVEFEWDDVNGATTYDIYIDGVFVGNQSTTTYMVTGLSPGDNVELEVIAVNDLPCPDVSRIIICTAIDCPPVDITFGNTGPHCFEAGASAIQLEVAVAGGLGGGTGEWDSPNVDPLTGIFTPSDNLDLTYSILYTYTEGACVYTDMVDVEVNIIPQAAIDVSDDVICVTETTMVSSPFLATNSEVPTWDFGAANVISGSGFGPYEIEYSTAGNYDVTLTIDNAGCISEMAVESITVDPELIAPQITCGPSNNSEVSFEWDPVQGVTEYLISIGGVTQTNQSQTGYTVTGLMEGESVEITLEFLTALSCSLNPISFTCTTSACPNASFSLAGYDDEMCLDGTQQSQQFNINLINGPNETGNGSWSGTGISSSGLFNPTGLAPENNIPLTYTIDFSECSYDTTVFMTLFEAPQVTSVIPINPDCYLDNLGEVDAVVTGGLPDYSYQVDNGPQQTSSIFSPINPGIHEMLVTDANGCTTMVTFDIIPAVQPPLSIGGPLSIFSEETGMYTLSTTAENIGDVIWLVNGVIVCQGLDCEPVTIAGADYPDDFELVVQVFFNEDCFIETSIRVDVFDIHKWYIPNVISNSDDENSNWRMFTKGNDILVKSVKIYDRWGELIHEKEINSTDREVDLFWSGNWGDQDGQPAIQGVYVYLIELEVEGRKIIEAGDVTIIR